MAEAVRVEIGLARSPKEVASSRELITREPGEFDDGGL